MRFASLALRPHWLRRARTVASIAAVLVAVLVAGTVPAASRALATPAEAAPVAEPEPAAESVPAAKPQTVTFDQYSLMIDGKRTFVWSGEFHPFRLPSPDLWRDVLQKMKASGYNAVSHLLRLGLPLAASRACTTSPASATWTGCSTIAAEVGLYVIARPGPYINAEVDGGGFPGWLTTQAGTRPHRRARLPRRGRRVAVTRSTDHRPAPVHQRHRHGDPVPDRERARGHRHDAAELHAAPVRQGPRRRHHRADLPQRQGPQRHLGAARLRRCRAPSPGPVDLYAFDGYPGGTCRTDATPGAPNAAPDWGIHGPGGAKGGATASPNTPGFVAEFGGGWFDYWGSNGTYPCTAVRAGPRLRARVLRHQHRQPAHASRTST